MSLLRPLSSLFALLTVAALAGCGATSPAPVTGGPDASTPDGSEKVGKPLPDGAACCPRDPVPNGCMNLGGSTIGGQCTKACDFFCSTNWQVVVDEAGCEEWTYGHREPLPGENAACQPVFDA